ncbi:MAG: Atu1372/SO_1960 family protein [Lacisediminihabitans sp.]
MTHSVIERLKIAGHELPTNVTAKGTYSLGVISGSQLLLAGHGPVDVDGHLITGTIGGDLSQEEGRVAARRAILAAIRTCELVAGGLENVAGLLALRVYLGSSLVADPIDVANAASEVVLHGWPSAPPPVRTVVMCEALPLGVPVVIEAVAQLAIEAGIHGEELTLA